MATSGGDDPVFARFRKRVAREPEQVVRYWRGGAPLWVSSDHQPADADVPPCPACGAPRHFEFQVSSRTGHAYLLVCHFPTLSPSGYQRQRAKFRQNVANKQLSFSALGNLATSMAKPPHSHQPLPVSENYKRACVPRRCQ